MRGVRFPFLLSGNRHKVKDVFTPSSHATVNYVERKKAEEQLRSCINQKGKQLFIYGYSRSGKSTFWKNYVDQHSLPCVTTQCSKESTFNDLVLNCLDQLNIYYDVECSHGENSEERTGVSVGTLSNKGFIASRHSSSDNTVQKRVTDPVLGPQNLVRYIGEAGYIWVVEDIHNLDDDTRKQLASLIKFFVDASSQYPNTRIVCIGTSEVVEELYDYNPDLRERVAHIHIRSFQQKELRALIDKGFELLNVAVSDDVKDKIVEYSANDASTAHQLCYYLCEQAGIERSSFLTRTIEDKCLNLALRQYAMQNGALFNQRLEFINKAEIRKDILRTFYGLKASSLPYSKIEAALTKKGYLPEEIMNEMNAMSEDSRDILRLDTTLNKYVFRNQFFKTYLDMVMTTESNKAHLNNIIAESELIFKDQNDPDFILWQPLLNNLAELKARLREEEDD